MTDSLAWVVGGGGLLGSHVLRAILSEMPGVLPWQPGEAKISWLDPARALSELARHVERFSRDVASGPRAWIVLWCAGAAVIGTRADALLAETACFESLLFLLRKHMRDLPGQLVLASSAGGVYGSNPNQPLTESSLCLPISDYGRNKLRQERLLLDWAASCGNVSTLVARIANLYGPGQNMNKPQGLITHISRSLLHRTPVHLYVPLDTLRDYVYAGDCAAHLIRCLDRLRHEQPEHIVKIFCSGETVTISGIIAAFTRIARGHPRIICSSHPAAPMHPMRLQYQSAVWNDVRAPTRTDLAVGIQRVHHHLMSLFQQGRLPPPTAH